MPRRKITASADAANAAPTVGFAPYDGPGGPLRCLLKQLSIKDNKNGDPMFKFLVEVHEPSGSAKAKHNGQSMWGQQNWTESSAGWVNGMMTGMGVPKADQKSLWTSGINVEKPDLNGNEKVISIGKWKVDPAGIPVVVLAKLGDPYTNPTTGVTALAKMEPASFLVSSGDAPPAAEPDEDEDDLATPAAVDSDEEDGEEEAEDESEEDDEEDTESDLFDARADELEELKKADDRPGLLKIAKTQHGLTVLKKNTLDDIIDMILNTEFPPQDESADDAEEEEAEEVEEPAAEPEPAPAAAPRRTGTRAAAKGAGATKKAPPF